MCLGGYLLLFSFPLQRIERRIFDWACLRKSFPRNRAEPSKENPWKERKGVVRHHVVWCIKSKCGGLLGNEWERVCSLLYPILASLEGGRERRKNKSWRGKRGQRHVSSSDTLLPALPHFLKEPFTLQGFTGALQFFAGD